jgi:hypothetical protein
VGDHVRTHFVSDVVPEERGGRVGRSSSSSSVVVMRPGTKPPTTITSSRRSPRTVAKCSKPARTAAWLSVV